MFRVVDISSGASTLFSSRAALSQPITGILFDPISSLMSSPVSPKHIQADLGFFYLTACERLPQLRRTANSVRLILLCKPLNQLDSKTEQFVFCCFRLNSRRNMASYQRALTWNPEVSDPIRIVPELFVVV